MKSGMGKMHLHGIIPPLATPLDERERVDEGALKNLVRQLLQAGVHGFFVLGSTGEFAHLQDDEKRRAIDIVLAEVNKAVPVLVGVTEAGTQRTIAWVKEAQKRGADSIVAAPPFYYPLTDDELERHFRALAMETDLPILLYHIPETTKIRIPLSVIARLAEVPNIIGIKDSTGDLPFFYALLDHLRDKPFTVLQGHEALLAPSLFYGAHGGINSLANLVPEWFVALYEAAKQGDGQRAFAWQQQINRLLDALESFPFLPALKASLHYRGWIPPTHSQPFTPLTEEQRQKLWATLHHFGIPSA